MRIQKTRIIKSENYLSQIPDDASFRLVSPLGDERDEVLRRCGFQEPPESGTAFLPSVIGPFTRFNADGKHVVRRDLPKEYRYTHTVYWTWKQWSGKNDYEEMSDFKDVFRFCYPRDLIAPPSVELSFIEYTGQGMLVSSTMKKVRGDFELVKHTINLMLEIAGACEIVSTDLASYSPPVIKKINWHMLPSGKYPWEKIVEHVRTVTRGKGTGTELVIMDRQQTIEALKPSSIFVGLGGFNDYIAYVFEDKGLVILESIRKDNAIYVFGKNWREVSRLTKAEVISAHHHVARIIHTKSWKSKLNSIFDFPKAAE